MVAKHTPVVTLIQAKDPMFLQCFVKLLSPKSMVNIHHHLPFRLHLVQISNFKMKILVIHIMFGDHVTPDLIQMLQSSRQWIPKRECVHNT